MRITVIPSDGAVYKDGVSYSGLTLSNVPSDVHALQWDTDKGWIEFVNESEFRRPPNEPITELPAWVNTALAAWDEADTAATNTVIEQPVADGVQTL
jgi:hypothetical protein